ncbi:peptidylprolyl isomerase [Haliea sp. E1-2-M8]|uniref:peptidylprolyl isomerase n=1 Tax=Haliea sp. E1-2-M8 TaxID=3064706 RepID=UPI00271CD2F1|nr:peptidylprolyl isomerase [Haliea sp. E1-2-M8]MDO8863543.1 peptidylprolyl isomerase [Haliea sp. E1-2-M8]
MLRVIPRRPWLHFLLLGALLFWLQSQLFPTPKPVVGPLGQARIEGLLGQWQAATGRRPEGAQLERILRAELERDMLFQHAVSMDLHRQDPVVFQRLVLNMQFLGLAGEEDTDAELFERALELRLHLGDEVVRRRLLQVMEQLLLASNPPQPASAAAIADAFAQRAEEFRQPLRYTFLQLFFDRNREAELADLPARIERENLDPEAALNLSSPFMHGYTFREQTPDQLARIFGAVFVSNLLAAEPSPNRWHGPLRSAFGWHYVWVKDVTPARPAELEEVRPILRRDLELEARNRALASAIAGLAERYELQP